MRRRQGAERHGKRSGRSRSTIASYASGPRKPAQGQRCSAGQGHPVPGADQNPRRLGSSRRDCPRRHHRGSEEPPDHHLRRVAVCRPRRARRPRRLVDVRPAGDAREPRVGRGAPVGDHRSPRRRQARRRVHPLCQEPGFRRGGVHAAATRLRPLLVVVVTMLETAPARSIVAVGRGRRPLDSKPQTTEIVTRIRVIVDTVQMRARGYRDPPPRFSLSRQTPQWPPGYRPASTESAPCTASRGAHSARALGEPPRLRRSTEGSPLPRQSAEPVA